MPDPRPLRPGEPDRFGDYRVLGHIGQGGQGSVYLAESPTGERVAIKVLHANHAMDDTAQRRFLREVSTTRRVATFSTARVIDVSMAGDRPYIVSEYVDGDSLQQRVDERGTLANDELVRLALGTASALAAIHAAGIVHRDFKPSNVLLGPDGPRVIDFGIARALDSVTATSSGVTGTPAYMAPEQIANKPLGPAADVFSWAVTMVFAATGRPAFGAASIPAILHAVLTAAPDLTGIPASLRSLLDRCLTKSPEARPTAADIMLYLVGRQTEQPPAAPIAGEARPSPPPTGPVPAYEPVSAESAVTLAPGIAGDATQPAASRRTTVRVGVPALCALLAVAITAGIWLWVSPSTQSSGAQSSGAQSPALGPNRLDKVGVAFDVGGRGDLWFNDSAALGLDRAKSRLGVGAIKELPASENETVAQKEQRLRALARAGYDPVLAIGFAYSEPVKTVALEFPDTTFAIVDSAESKGKNISNLIFAEEEGGYLAGAAAALVSKKNHVGFVGAVKDGAGLQQAAAGFVAGAKAVKADIEIDVRYLSRPPDFSGYNAPAKAKIVAAGLFAGGADVVFQAAGSSNLGVMRAAKEAGGQVIGAEADEARTADDSLRAVVATSVIKRIDTVVFDYLKAFAAGTAKPGLRVYGVKDEGIGYTTTGGGIDAVKARLDEFKKKIADGEISVPSS